METVHFCSSLAERVFQPRVNSLHVTVRELSSPLECPPQGPSVKFPASSVVLPGGVCRAMVYFFITKIPVQ